MVGVELYEDDLDPEGDSLMFESEGVVYEAERIGGSNYKVGLFGTLHKVDAEREEAPVEVVEVSSYENLYQLAEQLVEGYSGPQTDSLIGRREERLDEVRNRNLVENIQEGSNQGKNLLRNHQ